MLALEAERVAALEAGRVAGRVAALAVVQEALQEAVLAGALEQVLEEQQGLGWEMMLGCLQKLFLRHKHSMPHLLFFRRYENYLHTLYSVLVVHTIHNRIENRRYHANRQENRCSY